MTRRLLAPALVITLAAGISGVSTDAAAYEGESIVFEGEPGTTVERRFDTPMVSDGALTHDPGDCAVSPACIEYGMQVIAPDAVDDWVLDIAVDWAAVDIESGVAGGADSADVDLFVYEQQEVVNDDGGTETEWVQIASSETQGGRPERVKLFSPEPGVYAITVAVFTGATGETRLTLEYVDAAFEFPSPEAPTPPKGDSSTPRSVPQEVGSEVTPVPAPPPATATPQPRRSLAVGRPVTPTPTPVTSAPVFGPPAGADPDFGARFGTLDGRLGAGDPAPLSLAASRHPGVVEPVAIGTVLLFAVGIPLALVAVLFLVAFRFRPTPARLAGRRVMGGGDE